MAPVLLLGRPRGGVVRPPSLPSGRMASVPLLGRVREGGLGLFFSWGGLWDGLGLLFPSSGSAASALFLGRPLWWMREGGGVGFFLEGWLLFSPWGGLLGRARGGVVRGSFPLGGWPLSPFWGPLGRVRASFPLLWERGFCPLPGAASVVGERGRVAPVLFLGWPLGRVRGGAVRGSFPLGGWSLSPF